MDFRVAIPVPASCDAEYNARSLPLYLSSLRSSGAEPVVIAEEFSQVDIARLLRRTDGVLLPGSRFDVDPERYGAARELECGPADPQRTAVDELLLQDAFNLQKPVLAICHGAQSLNVFCGGSMVQDLKTSVVHRADRALHEAHPVRLESGSRLFGLLPAKAGGQVQVNSTHHQAISLAGGNLRIAAVSPGDGVIEAVESRSDSHFVVAVQWHPERTYVQSAFSRAIFSAFMEALRGR